MNLSAVICTHNPRADYMARTLAGLQQQSLSTAQWELVLVDNASREPLAARLDLRWHPAARIVAEIELGLTAARLRGIEEARAPLLVFVDDDNVLAPDYLARALDISLARADLGVWGCGHYTPEWERVPPPDFAPYLEYLAVGQSSEDRWSLRAFDYAATPAGAGLCVRDIVARKYAGLVRGDPRRKLLGRTGSGLAGCEDFDLAQTAIDLGLGSGVFSGLRMQHLMPSGRVEESYLLRLVEGHACSTVLLHALRQPEATPRPSGIIARLREWRFRRSLAPIPLKIHLARRRGEQRGWEQFKSTQLVTQ